MVLAFQVNLSQHLSPAENLFEKQASIFQHRLVDLSHNGVGASGKLEPALEPSRKSMPFQKARLISESKLD